MTNSIDFPGLWKLLTEHDSIKDGGCMMCDYRNVRESGGQCDKCPIIYNSAVTKGRKSRTGITSTIEKLFNIEKSCNIGKHHAFFFSYYSQFDFKFPLTPFIDILGTIDKNQNPILFKEEQEFLYNITKLRNLIWCVHHINMNDMDDRKENLGLMLSTEHTYLHKHTFHDKDKDVFISNIKERNRRMFGITCWG
jgi:hypothetical protein